MVQRTESATEFSRQKSKMSWLTSGLRSFVDRLHSSPEFTFILITLLVGVGAGIGAVIFRYLIQGVEWAGFSWFPQTTGAWGKAYVVIIPALGGLIVGPLVYFFAREAKGHGVPEVMEGVALRGGRIRTRVAVIKAVASSICIGSGGSVGREGPIVQIGSALGSSIGQLLNLSEERVRTLVACGAAGGIAATFNAPIAGVIFGLEIILGEFTVHGFSSVVIGAVSASVIGQAAFGNVPAFSIPINYGVVSLWEYAFYPFLGVLAALAGVLFTRVLYWSEDVFARWKSVPEWLQPAIGGAALGVLALAYPVIFGVSWEITPQIFNVGYGAIEGMLNNELALKTALVLLLFKLMATSLTLGSGGSGGIFAPALFMGAMLGGSYQLVLEQFFPGVIGPEGAYALLGMGAMFAAAAHAPITAVLILFELTGDYRIILPLMLTVVVATLVARYLLSGESIYTLKLSRRGIRLRAGWDEDVMNSVKVADAMTDNPITVQKDLHAYSLRDLFLQTNNHAFPVLDHDNKLVGVVSLTDYRRVLQGEEKIREDLTVDAIASHTVISVSPDETVKVALERMGPRDLSRLPVVRRDNPHKLLGIIRRNDIVEAYRLGTMRGSAGRQEERDLSEATRTELTLPNNSNLHGTCLADSQLPGKFFVLRLQRGTEQITPRGSTFLSDGDVLTILLRQEDLGELEEWWQSTLPRLPMQGDS